MSEIVKPAEAAKALSISTETLRGYAEEGRIPFVSTPGGHRRYIIEDVRYALLMEKSVTIPSLEDAEGEPRLAAEIPAAPIRRAPRWNAMSLDALAADAEEPVKEALRIPFIGKPGTGRFIIGQGVPA